MATLSIVALQVVTGLQDPHVRAAVIAAMRDTTARGHGLDLQDCQQSSVTRSLFDAAAKRGAQATDAMCRYVSALPGLILHMDHEQLSHWDPSVIPIVTAIAHPDARMPGDLTGYRSPSRTIDLGADKHLQGPILVVFPVKHPNRRDADRRALPAAIFTHVDSATVSHPHAKAP
jgi:hypothetical protein